LLAFFAFSVLPVNYAGLLLVLFGLSLFVLEIKVTSFGLLTAGGVVSLIFGSMILMDSRADCVNLDVIIRLSWAGSSSFVRLAVARSAADR
jgi:membrane-bound serine protease (ClpP class)